MIVSGSVEKIIDNSTLRLVSSYSKKDKKYKKFIMKSKTYLAHFNALDRKIKIGDLVSIKSSRPISKRKKWTLI
jgi:ribosomal protein S17